MVKNLFLSIVIVCLTKPLAKKNPGEITDIQYSILTDPAITN
jgi:hypothetical protein